MRRLHNRSMGIILTLAMASSILAMACGNGKETEPEKLIPEGSNLIAHVNLAGILASEGLASIFDAIPKDEDGPQTLDELLDEGVAEIGIDVRQFSRAVLFGDLTRDEEFFGIIAPGKFDELALISAVRSASEDRIISSDYKGRLLYSPENDSDSFTIAVLQGEILVAGTEEAVRAVIDVQDGARDRVSGPVWDAFNDLGLGLIKLQVDLTAADLAEQLPDLGDIPFLGGGFEGLSGALDPLLDIRLLGLSVAQNGQILILRANLDFANEDSASKVSNILDGILKLGAGFSPDPEVAEVLEGVELSRDESRVTIRLEAPASAFGGLLTSVVGISSEETAVEERSRTVPRTGDRAPRPVPVPASNGSGKEIPIMPSQNHVPVGQPVEYSTTPPTSGDHWEQWADCGFYQEALPDELITHNLEHGNIVLSYNLAGQQALDQLRKIWAGIGRAPEWGVARFYDKIAVGTVLVAAWGRLDIMRDLDAGRISKFFGLYAGNLGPERIPCLP